jgi:hypothetical protein
MLRVTVTCPKCNCLTMIEEEWLTGNIDREFYKACPLCDIETITTVKIETKIKEVENGE